MTTTSTTTGGAHHAADQLGALEALDDHTLHLPTLGRTVRGKVFLKERLGLTGMEVSLTRLPAGVAIPFLHRHRDHEELYLVVGGRGELIVDGQVIPLREGSAVRVGPAGARSLRSAPDAPLVYVCVQARDGSMPDAEAISDGAPVPGPVPWPA